MRDRSMKLRLTGMGAVIVAFLLLAERGIIMPSPVRIYAGTQEGLFVWRSKNGSWEKISVTFETGTIDSVDGLKAQPNVVFLVVNQDGLYGTDDAGKSWRRVCKGRAVTADQPVVGVVST